MLCCECFPAAGHANVICETHLRQQLAQQDPFGPPASADAIIGQVLPVRYRDADPTRTLPELAGVDIVRSGVLLHGPAGRGKTFQASLAMQAAIRAACHAQPRGVEVGMFQWHNAAALFERLRAAMRDKDDADATRVTVDHLAAAKVLVLDDLGAERPTDWVLERLYDIVNRRYESRRSIVVTSNLTPQQMETQLGARITGRLIEMCRVIHVTGEQRRKPLTREQTALLDTTTEGGTAA